MLFECKLCNRVKKFGEWVEAPLEFGELAREIGVEVIYVVCPYCGEGSFSASGFGDSTRYGWAERGNLWEVFWGWRF